ncbi:MAG: protein-glutamate O-methyltransferase CheR [Pseudomonadota bacterium]
MISEADFTYVRTLLRERSGIALADRKMYLVNTRLKPIAQKEGFADIAGLLAAVRKRPRGPLATKLVEAMTTNESLFFRDRLPFEALVKLMIPAVAASRPGGAPIKIWCAAASTGQEPYSVAMVLDNAASKLPPNPVEIYASDLSSDAISRARTGTFTDFEVGRGMPDNFLPRYFRPTGDHCFQIIPSLKQKIRFDTRNLMEPFGDVGRVDIVFCRNVLIYFDKPTKIDVLTRLAKTMPSDGYLVLGGAETTLGLCDGFRAHKSWRNLYLRPTAREVIPLASARQSA